MSSVTPELYFGRWGGGLRCCAISRVARAPRPRASLVVVVCCRRSAVVEFSRPFVGAVRPRSSVVHRSLVVGRSSLVAGRGSLSVARRRSLSFGRRPLVARGLACSSAVLVAPPVQALQLTPHFMKAYAESSEANRAALAEFPSHDMFMEIPVTIGASALTEAWHRIAGGGGLIGRRVREVRLGGQVGGSR